MDVSRIDQGRANEENAWVDIGSVIQEVIATLSGEAQKRKILLIFEEPKVAFPKVFVARGHIFEAIENLISNALRYNRSDGKVSILVDVKNDNLEIRITDTGIGIPQEDQSKIFSKFFRASNAVRSFTDGSGLGLSVVKSYVEESGGTVRFESQENIGTTFIMSLPITEEN